MFLIAHTLLMCSFVHLYPSAFPGVIPREKVLWARTFSSVFYSCQDYRPCIQHWGHVRGKYNY